MNQILSRAKGIFIRFTHLACCLLLFANCEDLPHKPGPPYNPLDLNNPNYILPQVIITSGPDSNSIILADDVTFRWIGNLDNMEFRYRLNDSGFSQFEDINTVTYNSLDENHHVFEIQGSYSSGARGYIKNIPFKIDAVPGPALILKPRNILLSRSFERFDVELWIDDTDPVAGISVKLLYNPQEIQFYNIDFFIDNQESFLLENGGELISFSDNDTVNGVYTIDCAVVTGDPKEVSGSGKIAKISAIHKSGTSLNIAISSQSKLRNSNNDNVQILNLRGTQINL